MIDSIDENGYFTGSLDEIAARLQAPVEQAERILRLIQGFDPSGVGARDSAAECLAINLRERDRSSTRPCKRLSAIWTCSQNAISPRCAT